ncbi:MAG TPA: peptidylprolyl isomerase, partial [Bacteroidales bacterium]|nr:peptidylprolyl isomerase [Bacteroidales bacterium]
IYPFETAAYNTPIGQISMPIRSQFGYHLVYVTDIIRAIKSISIGQIFVSDTLATDHQMSDSSRIKLSLIQSELKAGTPFETVAARYSDDTVSKDKGGQVEPFAPNRRTGDFVKAVITLPAGKVSEPIATNYGWHIVQLIAVSYVTIDDDMEYSLRNRISRDSRSFKSKSSFITKIKKEYNYNEAGKTKAIKFFLKNMPEEFFQSKTVKLDELKGIEKLQPMATYADQTITATDFANYINRFKGMQLKKEEIESFLNERFDMYIQDNMMRYENDHILEKYPELRELVKEFHDGMVLYEINTQNVWGKAVSDTVGLEQFYQSHLSKYTDPTTLEISKLNNIKAIVITDYQEYLDQKWLAELRKKYNPRVNEALFSTLLKK